MARIQILQLVQAALEKLPQREQPFILLNFCEFNQNAKIAKVPRLRKFSRFAPSSA